MNFWRRFIVVLICANLGIVLWSLLHTEHQQFALPMTEPGTPGLILRQEYLQLKQTGSKPLPGQCWQIGPFATEAELRRAWQSLEYITLDMQRRKASGASAMGYSLKVPASASLKDAELLRESMISAGVAQIVIGQDFSLDLGRYTNLESAQRQQRIVQQLGIEAVLSSLQSSRVEWWIDSRIRNQPAFEQWQAEQRPAIPVKACS